eukprot:TRINITY_DN22724_c0_g1_i1.p1 TRINITY_DN22724_c0_g1~~TRINITY_DN22724_c0_g1_i1.p1  ORF type:complete len:1024 (+),score=168.73 TRINITY_DN22724_c0_g1_i1:77-3148(+)
MDRHSKRFQRTSCAGDLATSAVTSGPAPPGLQGTTTMAADDDVELPVNLTAEEIIEARRSKLQTCKLWTKLRNAQVHKVQKSDVDELFAIFDTQDSGEISPEELMEIKHVKGLSLSHQDIRDLCLDADKDGSGMITAVELYKSFTQGEVAFSLLKKSMHQKDLMQLEEGECLADDLIDWMTEEYEIRSALWSLPQTFVLFCAFFFAAAMHFDMRSAWNLQFLWTINRYGIWYNIDWIFDHTTFFDWLQFGWLDFHFLQDLDTSMPGRLNGHNQVIGAYRLRREVTQPANCSMPVWLEAIYYPFPLYGSSCYKTGERTPDDQFFLVHEKKDVVRERIVNLTRGYWLDNNSTSVSVDSLFVNPMLKSVTLEQLRWDLENNGFWRPRTYSETFKIDPYSNLAHAIPDVIFVCLILKIMYAELKELLPTFRLGLDGIVGYFQFWNIIDWFAILWGLLCAAVWVLVCVKVAAFPDFVAQLPLADLSEIVLTNKSYMTPEEVNIVISHEDFYARLGQTYEAAEDISLWHEGMRDLSVIYLFFLMMKFFKAFKANRRLDVVIQTLVGSAVDVAHFMIVFLSIFLCYSWAGHTMFGFNHDGFSTLYKSMFTCWRSGIGMADLDDLNYVGQAIGYIYTLTYELLVLNLLLGILFGLIFEAYGRTKAEIGDAPTVYEQYTTSVQIMRKTANYLDEWDLLCSLVDDEQPAHPGELVTARSLRQAFISQNMTKENALYLVEGAAAYRRKRIVEYEMDLQDALRVIFQMRTIVLRAIHRSESLIDLLRQEARRPQELRYDAIMLGVDPDDPDALAEVASRPRKGQFAIKQTASSPSSPAKSRNTQLALGNGNSSALVEHKRPRVEDEEERLLKEDEIRLKAQELSDAVVSLQSERSTFSEELRNEMQGYHISFDQFNERLSETCLEISAVCDDSEISIAEVANCFDGCDLQALHDLPEKCATLVQYARASRKAVSEGTIGGGSDPLKRLKKRISDIGGKCGDLLSEADAQSELCQSLSKFQADLEAFASNSRTNSR